MPWSQSSVTIRLTRLFDQATPGQLEQGALWYPSALEVAEGLMAADHYGIEVNVAVLAATSPRLHWSRNVKVAGMILYDNTIKPPGMTNRSYQAAIAAISKGPEALTGPKVKAFYRAIMGDEEAIVVDVWMMRAAGIEHDSPNVAERVAVERGIRAVAAKRGVSPRTAQATIWIVMRGRTT